MADGPRPRKRAAAFREAIARKARLRRRALHARHDPPAAGDARRGDRRVQADDRVSAHTLPKAHLSLGQALTQTGQKEQAAEAFAEAERLNKRKADAQASTFAVSVGLEKLKAGDAKGRSSDSAKPCGWRRRTRRRITSWRSRSGASAPEPRRAPTSTRRRGWRHTSAHPGSADCPCGASSRSISLVAASIVVLADGSAPIAFSFTNIAQQAGLTADDRLRREGREQVPAGDDRMRRGGARLRQRRVSGHLLVNGTVLEGFPKGSEPTNHLYRNQRDGTFEDMTANAGLTRRLGPGRVRRRLRQRRLRRSLRDLLGAEPPVPEQRQRRRSTTSRRGPGLTTRARRWGAGCAFVDYDRDGRLDLFAANYIDLDLEDRAGAGVGLCRYKGVPVACGPPGLPGGKNMLYRNKGDGTFEDVSERVRHTARQGTYGSG